MSQHGDITTLVRAYKFAMREVAEAKAKLIQADEHLTSQSLRLRTIKSHIDTNRRTANKPRSRTVKDRCKSRRVRHEHQKELYIRSICRDLVEQRQDALRDFKSAKHQHRVCQKLLDKKGQQLEQCAAQLGRFAGVDESYGDSLKVVLRVDVIDFYFGGLDRPDGEDHGHYVMAFDTGDVMYRRDPGEPRGAHNYIDSGLAC